MPIGNDAGCEGYVRGQNPLNSASVLACAGCVGF